MTTKLAQDVTSRLSDFFEVEMKLLLLGSIGVVAETSELQRRAYNMAFAEHGLDWYWSVANYCELLRQPGGIRRLTSYSSGALPDDLIAKIHQAKGHFFKELLQDGISCRVGVAECVKACLQNGVKIGFITTTTQENISVLQEALKSQIDFNDFDLVTTKGDVVREKPDGEVYHLALERFGIPPEDVVAVEDTEVNQEAALQAGLLCYLFAGEYATTSHNLNAVRSLHLIADNVALDAS